MNKFWEDYKIIVITAAALLAVSGLVAVGHFTPSNQTAQTPSASQSTQQSNSSSTDAEISNLQKEIAALQSNKSNGIPQQSNNSDTAEINNLKSQLAQLQNTPSVLSTPQIVQKLQTATVMIRTDLGCGTGVIVNSDGLILTADHVVNGASYVTIYLNDGSAYSGAIVNENSGLDLASLKIQQNNLPVVSFGDSSVSGTPLGENVVALGFPLTCNTDQTLEIETGNISARRDVSDYSGFGALVGTLLQTSARINPGDSGGPLVDQYGNVIGINEKIVSASFFSDLNDTGIGFAIPIDTAKSFLGFAPAQNSVGQVETQPSQPVAPTNPRQRTITSPDGKICQYDPVTAKLTVYNGNGSYVIPRANIVSWSPLAGITFVIPPEVPDGTYQAQINSYDTPSGQYCLNYDWDGKITIP